MRVLFICSFILFSKTCLAQTISDWNRYSNFWVLDIDREEQFLISSNPEIKSLGDKELKFIIPDIPNKKLENGNKYIIAYLINFSSDTVDVPRADATIANSSTRVLVSKNWLLFQKSAGSSCGNSYWTMKLAPKHYIILQIENTENNGTVRVPFKAIINVNHKNIESNQSYIFVSKERLKLAGEPIKNISF